MDSASITAVVQNHLGKFKLIYDKLQNDHVDDSLWDEDFSDNKITGWIGTEKLYESIGQINDKNVIAKSRVDLGEITDFDLLKKFALDHVCRRYYDETLIDSGYIPWDAFGLDEIENANVCYQYHKGKFGLASRGFIFLEVITGMTEDHVEVMTIPCPDVIRGMAMEWVTVNKGHVFTQADMIIAGFRISKSACGKEFTLSYLQCIEPNLGYMVPRMLINKLIKDQIYVKLHFGHKFREYIKNEHPSMSVLCMEN